MSYRRKGPFQWGRAIARAGLAIALSLAMLTLAILAISFSQALRPFDRPAQAQASISAQGEPSMQPEDIRAVIQQARQAWMTGDAESFAALFAPEGEFVVPGQVLRGAEAIRTAAADFATSNTAVSIDIRRILIQDNQAVVEWHWQDTEKATGKRSKADDAIVVDFQDGKITRWREYIDTATPQ